MDYRTHKASWNQEEPSTAMKLRMVMERVRAMKALEQTAMMQTKEKIIENETLIKENELLKDQLSEMRHRLSLMEEKQEEMDQSLARMEFVEEGRIRAKDALQRAINLINT